MNPRLLLLAPLLLVSILSFAQKATLKGLVYDAKNGEPLIGATVTYSENKGVITGINGEYSFVLDTGTYEVRFSYLGYSEQSFQVELKPGETFNLDVELGSGSVELDLVVVTASRYGKSIEKESVTVDVLSEDLAKNTNATDLNELVQKSPGVVVADNQISIRGGSSYSYGVGSRTAVLTDGLNLMSSDFGEAQLNFAPIENVEQVEVIKGASSVAYGSSALNGVVNVRTKWASNETPETEISNYFTLYGNPKRKELIWWDAYQPYQAGIFVNHRHKINNLQLVAGGNLHFFTSFLEDNNNFRLRANVKTRYIHPKKKGLSFGVNANVMRETNDRFFISQDLDTNAYRKEEGSEDRYWRTAVDPHLTYQNSNGHNFELKVRYLNIFRRGNDEDPNAVDNTWMIDPQYQKSWQDGKWVLTTGLPITTGWSRSNLYEGTRATIRLASFVQGEFNINRLGLIAGVRYEFSRVDTLKESAIPVFRTGLNYQAGKATFLRASFGQGYRLPSVGERFVANDLFSGVYLVPRPELEPERGWSAEVGVKQGVKISNWKGFIDFNFFLQEYQEFVEYRFGLYSNRAPDGTKYFPDEGETVIGFKPFNIEQARISGLELSLMGQGDIGPVKVTTLVGYNYHYPGDLEADSTQRNMGTFLKNTFKHMFSRIDPDEDAINSILQFRSRHNVRGDIQFEFWKVGIGYSLYYNSFPEKIPETFVLVVDILDEGSNTLQKYVDNHVNGDLWMDMRFFYNFSENTKLSFIIKNFTNLEYSQRPGRLEPPINFTFQLRHTFK